MITGIADRNRTPCILIGRPGGFTEFIWNSIGERILFEFVGKDKYLGKPILKILIDKDHYKNIYEYEEERRALFTASTDIADVLSLGLTNLLISPVDRFNGTKHLIAIVFEVRDSHEENDRIARIIDKVSFF